MFSVSTFIIVNVPRLQGKFAHSEFIHTNILFSISQSTNTVNVTVIKNGTGLYDVNGIKLVQERFISRIGFSSPFWTGLIVLLLVQAHYEPCKFFNYDAMCIMKALAPFSILQQVISLKARSSVFTAEDHILPVDILFINSLSQSISNRSFLF